MIKPSLGVALIGTGRVAYQFDFSPAPDNHAEAISACVHTHIVAGVNRGAEKLAAFGERFGVSDDALFHDYREMLDTAKPELVIVATHPELHCEMVRECAAAPSVRAIICEKPMALTVDECDHMIAACQGEQVALQINHNRRWHPEWELAKKLLADGAIGELNHIYCYMDGGKPDPSWRSENEGPLLHDFTHYFDLMDLYGGPVSWLCGMAEQRWRPWAVEDMTGALVKFVGGATGSIYGAELSVYGDNGFELRGRTGVIRMLGEQVHLWQSEQGMYEPDSGFQWSELREQEIARPERASTYVRALDELIAHLDDAGDLRSDGEVGRRSLEMVSAVYESQLDGNRPVSFPVSRRDNLVHALRATGQYFEKTEEE
ncbi:MAG: Gfo/Idh/MocA family oxidoreductase [Candidatus Latescibacterota bacterium]|nr:Gfo/Idh/MocA family oxidoreductase [Candidatus Latescibacterota bacterium]